MITRFGALLIAMTAMACGNSGGGGGSLIDAPAGGHDAPGGAGQFSATVQSFGSTPTFIEYYTTSTGAWHTPTVSGMNYVVEVGASDTIEVVAVCVDGAGNSSLSQANFAFPADTQATIQCFGSTAPPPATVEVTGTMNQTGAVWFQATNASSTTQPWSYDVELAPATYDVIALGSNAVQIQRGVAIAAATTLPAIDVAANGTAYDDVAITVANQGTDAIAGEVDWLTPDGFVEIPSTGTTLVEPPASLMTTDDYLLTEVVASGSGYIREDEAVGAATSFALPDRLTGITFAADGSTTRATWSALPTVTSIGVELEAEGTTAQTASITATPAWIAATSATALEPDGSAPDFQAGWLPAPATTAYEEFEAADFGASDQFSVVYAEPHGGGVRAPGDRVRARARARARERAMRTELRKRHAR